MAIFDKLFRREKKSDFATCMAVVARGYMKEASKTELAEALNSTVSCPSCKRSFKFVQMVKTQGQDMVFICPFCNSEEARIKTV